MQMFHYHSNAFYGATDSLRYKAYTLSNIDDLLQARLLSEEQRFAIEVVGRVFPFKTNSYVVEELIDWTHFNNDPIFFLTFPQREMLSPGHFEEMATAVRGGSEKLIRSTADRIRSELNPHPAGQVESNIPSLDGERLKGMQHKYKETILYFPAQGQTCHAFCSFCFRWPQFVGAGDLKFSMKESERLARYLRKHPEATDILITGGDPLIMRADKLASHINAILSVDGPDTIRIGTKALGFWPYRFTTDPDADELLALFRKVVRSGRHLALMAHFSHTRELETPAVREAIGRILETGAQIRTQAPLLAHINDSPEVWSQMWTTQVRLGCVPYYMFMVRDTGAQEYFGVPLVRAHKIFRRAYQNVSGLCRTVRGPVMSSTPGKVHMLGVSNVGGEQVIVLQLLQGRNPDWVKLPFFAKYDEKAIWLDELKPAFGKERFFFELG
jgi:L-lysine 2,3-aminomutase